MGQMDYDMFSINQEQKTFFAKDSGGFKKQSILA